MILPSGAPTTLHPAHPSQRWSPDHLRLHRPLLRHPGLLPAGAPLLLAVSVQVKGGGSGIGGQIAKAMEQAVKSVTAV